jgi:hypothetical protein
MRQIIYILILFLLGGCSIDRHKNKPKIVIDASVIRSYDTILKYRDTKLFKAYDVRLSIRNKSNKPISFWMMTCSWEDNFIVNNDYIYFLGHACDGNSPWITHLKSNESKVLTASIIKIENTRYQSVESTRFGLIYIDSMSCKSPSFFDEIIGDKSKHDTIIWSNALSLSDKR